jgi:hypothetical protein
MSTAKQLVLEWANKKLHEDRYYVSSSTGSPASQVDYTAKNPFEYAFGADPQKRIDQARARSAAKPLFPSEFFGEDGWAKAKNNELNHPDNQELVTHIKGLLGKQPGNQGLEGIAARMLTGVGALTKQVVAKDNAPHYLSSVYKDKNDKLVGIYHDNEPTQGTRFVGSRVHVPLEGQSPHVKYFATGQKLYGDWRNWNHPDTDSKHGVFRDY